MGNEWIDTFPTSIVIKDRLEDYTTARWDEICLDAFERVLGMAIWIHPVEDRAYNMEIAVEVRSRVDHIEPHSVAHIDFERVIFILYGAAIEDDVARLPKLFGVPVRLYRAVIGPWLCIKFTLYQHELLIGVRPPSGGRIDDDRQIHPLHEVHG